MRLHLYLRNGKVIISTLGAVHQRLHRDIEPVEVADVSDAEGIRQAIHATIARGNPPTPYYKPGIHPQPVVVKYAGVRSWSACTRDIDLGHQQKGRKLSDCWALPRS